MAQNDNGYSARKGAIAAARKVLGKDAVIDAEFEVYETEGGRFNWKAVERKAKSRRTSGKGSPFDRKPDNIPGLDDLPVPGAAEPGAAEPGTLGPVFSEPNLPTETVTEGPAEELGAPLQDGEGAKPSTAASAFGAFAFGQLGNNHSTEKRTEGSGRRTSDKPAGEKKTRTPPVVKNGVRQPSTGTVCREVWDELDKLREAGDGVPPDSKQVRKLAEDKKWNANNASIEFYQWRKFNGITGRSKPAAPAPKEKK